jgi:DnaJ-class molecular chaperone
MDSRHCEAKPVTYRSLNVSASVSCKYKATGFDQAYQGQDREMVIPSEALVNVCVGVRSQTDEDECYRCHEPGDAHQQWTFPAIGMV